MNSKYEFASAKIVAPRKRGLFVCQRDGVRYNSDMPHETPGIINEDIWGEKKEKEQPTGKEILDKVLKEVEDEQAKAKLEKKIGEMWEGVEQKIVQKNVDEIFKTEEQKLAEKRKIEEQEKMAKSVDWEKLAEEAKKKEDK